MSQFREGKTVIHIYERRGSASEELPVLTKHQSKNFLIIKQDVFAKPSNVGKTKFGTYKIKIIDIISVQYSPQRLLLFKRDILLKELKRLEKSDLTAIWSP